MFIHLAVTCSCGVLQQHVRWHWGENPRNVGKTQTFSHGNLLCCVAFAQETPRTVISKRQQGFSHCCPGDSLGLLRHSWSCCVTKQAKLPNESVVPAVFIYNVVCVAYWHICSYTYKYYIDIDISYNINILTKTTGYHDLRQYSMSATYPPILGTVLTVEANGMVANFANTRKGKGCIARIQFAVCFAIFPGVEKSQGPI